MYKVKNDLCPRTMKDIFVLKTYGNEDFVLPKVKTVNRGLETVRYRGPKTWKIVPEDIKNSHSLAEFKAKIKNWKPVDCDCRLCKAYIQGLGYGVLKQGDLHEALGLLFDYLFLSGVLYLYTSVW